MRIAIASEYYRPWPGGISEHVHHEAEELARRGHQVAIVTGPGPDGEAPPGVELVRLGPALRFTSNGAASRLVLAPGLLRLRALFARLRPDLLHVHAPLDPSLAWASLLAARAARVGTFHASFAPAPLWELLYRRLRPLTGRLFRRLHGRIAVSEEARRSIHHYFPADYAIVPNGIDAARFRPEGPRRPELVDGRPTLLFVGRPDPRKGLPLLLEAFGALRPRVPGLRLVAVGVTPREAAALHPAAASAAAADLLFPGYVPADELPAWYRGASLFCSPALGGESQGIVLLEAMASGVPAVASAIPGYRDAVSHGVDGWLVPAGDAGALAAALERLLLDPALRARLAAAARRTALRHAWPDVARRLEDHFDAARAAWRAEAQRAAGERSPSG